MWVMTTCIEDPETGEHYAELEPRYDGPLPAFLMVEDDLWEAVSVRHDGAVLLRRYDHADLA